MRCSAIRFADEGEHSENIDVSIVVVTWNSGRFVHECLASLEAAEGTFVSEIIVVDNGSSDGTPEIIAHDFPNVELLRAGENLGFARGSNLGIAHCRGKYICLVNVDVNVPPPCISTLWSYMESHCDVGMAGPQLVNWSGIPGRSSMKFWTLWRVFCRAIALDRVPGTPRWCRSYLSTSNRDTTPQDVDILNGWFWMVRRQAVTEVGVLDPRFFMYAEDLDWCHRFHQAGWRVVLHSDAAAIHYGGGSSARDPLRFLIERERANLQYWRKFHGRLSTLVFRFLCGLNLTVRFVGYAAVSCMPCRDHAAARLKRRYSLRCLLRTLAPGSQ